MNRLLLTSLAALPVLPGDFVRAFTFTPCPDLDGDGVPELAIGLPRDDAHGPDGGRVFILSGRRGSILLELHAEAGRLGYGFGLACGADADGDGREDLLVCAHRDGFPQVLPTSKELQVPPETAGELFIVSLPSGRTLRRIPAPEGIPCAQSFASAAHFLGDCDGDGVSDILVESRLEANLDGGHSCPWYLVSGQSGKVLRRLDPSPVGRPQRIGDLDGDRVLDLALSGEDGIELLSMRAGRPFEGCAVNGAGLCRAGVRDAGDWDGDGRPDLLLVGRMERAQRCADVVVAAPGRVEPLFVVRGERLRSECGCQASSAASAVVACSTPDVDGDGRRDLVVAVPDSWRSLRRDEWSRLFPGREFPLGESMLGWVALLGSKDGSTLWTTIGTSREKLASAGPAHGLGDELELVGDFDGDGVSDLGVAACFASTSEPYEVLCGGVRVHSTKDGELLLSVQAEPGKQPTVLLGGRLAAGAKPR